MTLTCWATFLSFQIFIPTFPCAVIKCPQYLNKALGVQQCAGRCVAKMRKCERKEGEKNWVSANKLTQF